MRPVSIRTPALLFAGFTIGFSTIAVAEPPSPNDLSARAEEYMAARVERGKFSGTVLIARAGQVLFCKGYGLANLELDVPCSPKTKFRLGSITKQFTAMAILILQERGKLSVADHVKKHLPDAPKAWDDLTIHHLLTHTGGIPNYTSFPDFLKTLRDPITPRKLIAKFKDKPLGFKPGEKIAYSNSGYIVLGQIIETASGMSYASFVKQAIFDPLEMHDSGYEFTPTKYGYGYGWNIDRKFGQPRYEHGGGIPGFVTVIERFPDEKLLVVGLSNLVTSRIGAISDDLAAIALAQPYVVPREPNRVKVDDRVLELYIGSYEAELADGKEAEFAVSASDGRLTIHPKGMAKLEAVPESETRFYLKPGDGLAEFVRAHGGPADSLEVLIGNRKIRAKRVALPTKASTGAQLKPSAIGTPPTSSKPSKVPILDHKP